jgi:hypothetical protein
MIVEFRIGITAEEIVQVIAGSRRGFNRRVLASQVNTQQVRIPGLAY